MAKHKTILLMEITNKEFHIQYTGSFKPSDDKEKFKHDARIMNALASDRDLFDFFYRLVKPVERHYRRQARKSTSGADPKGTDTGLIRD